MSILWTAYCTTCQKKMFEDYNGAMAEAFARMHLRGTGSSRHEDLGKPHPDHKVLVGYFYTDDEK